MKKEGHRRGRVTGVLSLPTLASVGLHVVAATICWEIGWGDLPGWRRETARPVPVLQAVSGAEEQEPPERLDPELPDPLDELPPPEDPTVMTEEPFEDIDEARGAEPEPLGELPPAIEPRDFGRVLVQRRIEKPPESVPEEVAAAVVQASDPRPAPELVPLPGNAAVSSPASPNYADNPVPRYPALARRRGWEGVTTMRVRVGCDGRCLGATIETSSGYPVLDDAALQAVWMWTFEPAVERGVVVEDEILVPIRFQLSG